MRYPVVLLLIALLAGATLAGCVSGPTAPAPNETNAAGETVGPSWAFTDTDGQTHDRDAAMGDPTILFFMATWCGSCRQNAPRLADIHREYAPQGLDIHSLSWDRTETARDLEDWKERHDQPWPHGLDPDNAIAKTFGITSQSSIVVLDADGLPVKRFGYPGASASALAAAVDDAFARAA